MERQPTNWNNWLWPGVFGLLMLYPLYEMGRMYLLIPENGQLENVDVVLEKVTYYPTNTWFTFQYADSTLSLAVFNSLHEDLKSNYGGSFNYGDTFSVQFTKDIENQLIGLKLREHVVFDLADYRESQIQAIKEGPFIFFTYCLVAIGAFAILIAFIPLIRRKSVAKVKRELLGIPGVSMQGDNTYSLSEGGYSITLHHYLRIVVSKYGNKNEVVALIAVPRSLSTEHYTKLVGRFDTRKEDGQYYVLVTQRINFRLNTNRLLTKVKQQIEALNTLGNQE